MANGNYTEKIVQLLDGELPLEETSRLHQQIASDEALQKELQDHIMLKNMMSKSLNAPPDFLKKGILNNVGLNKNQYLGFIYLIPILLAFGLGYFLSDYNFSDRGNNFTKDYSMVNLNLLKPSEISNSSKKFESSNNFPLVSAKAIAENDIKEKNAKNVVKEKEKYSKIKKSNPIWIKKSSLNDIAANSIDYHTIKSFESYANSELDSKSINKISIEIRGLDLNNFHKSDVPNYNTGINNFAVSAYYSLNNKFKIGAELGQENFIQKYNFNDGEFTSFFEQNYTANFFGVSAKYSDSFIEELPNLDFYSRAFIGGMMTGPMGRLEAGLSYNFLGYKMFLGYDLAHITYFYQGNDFHSTKSGFTYGISIDL